MLFWLFFALFLIIIFYNCYWKRRNLPPGPMPLPVLGNMLSLIMKPPPVPFLEWREKYGDVFTFWQAGYPQVVVADYDLIVEHFVKDGDTFAGRPLGYLELMEFAWNGKKGILFTDGDVWRDIRRFSLHTLRDFGLGKNLMQERILDEVSHMISTIREKNKENPGQSQSIRDHIDISVGSIIMQLIFGYRYSSTPEKQAEFFEFKQAIDDLFACMGSVSGAILMFSKPETFKNWPILGTTYNRIRSLKSKLWKMLENNIEKRRKYIDFNSYSDPIDYTEAFLRKQHEFETKEIKSAAFNEDQLTGALFDLWVAGQETTSNTLGWGCIYLINRPDIQKKLQHELDRVIGSDRLITVDDKSKLPYLNAVITEIQRISNIIPVNILHRVTKDVTINGYFIPKDTDITNQISCVLYDSKFFPCPFEFRPERHLDENGDFKPHLAMIPFGVGKRACLGESLGRMELFLFAANIFHNFTLVSSDGKPLSEERKLKGTLVLPKFTCKIIERH